MKKTALIFISLALIAAAAIAPKVKAQTFDFAKAYQDYLFSQSVYQSSHSAFEDSRDFYLKNQTLTLKEDARKKTLTMLKDRDRLTSVYLTMLRMKVVEVKGLTGDERSGIFGKIDPEVKWYQDHEAAYQTGDPLETLFTKSAESSDRYKNTTQPIIYESLFDISLGTETGIRQDQEAAYSSLKGIVDAGVTSGKLDPNPFNRWFSDIDTLIAALRQNGDKAKTQIANVYGQYYSIVGSYNTSTDTLTGSLTSLSELNRFLTEVLTSLKNQK